MKQARRYFEKLLNDDFKRLTNVGFKVKKHRREIDRIEYKALKTAFMIRVSEGAAEHIRMMIVDFDYNIGAWQKLKDVHNEESVVADPYNGKIGALNDAKDTIWVSGVEKVLSEANSVPEARDALMLALKVCEQVEDVLRFA